MKLILVGITAFVFSTLQLSAQNLPSCPGAMQIRPNSALLVSNGQMRRKMHCNGIIRNDDISPPIIQV